LAGADGLATRLTKKIRIYAERNVSLAKHPEHYVRLSRLLFVLEEFPLAIAMTTNLAMQVESFWQRWPEQIFVYFPKPYLEHFARFGKGQAIDSNTLLAIARQESAFNAGVKSGAGAYGLMQLIIPTARALMKQLKPGSQFHSAELLKPYANIQLGSRYLNNLHSRFAGRDYAVFAAYNAGAAAVEKWLTNRPTDDPYVWIESIPYGETRSYTRNVWRNKEVYLSIDRFLRDNKLEARAFAQNARIRMAMANLK
jgi:soluble lytic murein transglycosylase-like protein